MNYTLVGKKIGMTQVYDESRSLVPVTVIEAGPCPVTQVKTQETDRYDAIQIAFGQRKAKNTAKAMQGHVSKAGQASAHTLREVRGKAEYKVGDVLTVAGFEGIKMVDVIGITKGHGFQGNVKRHGQAGQPAHAT
jgi:large subunit ribosomal protein L3